MDSGLVWLNSRGTGCHFHCMLGLYPLRVDEDEKDQARRYTSRMASDLDDEFLLFSALGLI